MNASTIPEAGSIFQTTPHSGATWLAAFSLCSFFCTTMITAYDLTRACGRTVSPVVRGVQMRKNLLIGLLVANTARICSLAALISFGAGLPPFLADNLTPLQLCWVRDLIAILPSVAFLSAFSILILFWTHVHYATTMVSFPLLDCLFVCINVACYLLLAAIVIVTFLLRKYEHLWRYMTCVVGFLNVGVATSLLYFGLVVVFGLSLSARSKSPTKRLVPRILVLSIALPLALLVRGVCYIDWDMSLGHPTWFEELLICLSSEWLPTVITLASLDSAMREIRTRPQDSLDDSSDGESPLLHEQFALAVGDVKLSAPLAHTGELTGSHSSEQHSSIL